ncbi:ABC transporter ATP-binding protein [Pedobacter faecalis]|uniref:ABC transporter ATP-binding protein n=1 Tax=Pedobacter faecalis TaxID=3041495 RepID=UPI00254DFA5C|nr:ATP-binding cassette domain-containing protein [Pedobacter sp. ELA7]
MNRDTAIHVSNLSKVYYTGQINSRTLGNDLKAWYRKLLERGYSRSTSATKNFPAEVHWALRGVSFQIQKGETLAICGGNGAGKSTLLKIISKITTPTSGSVIGRGRVIPMMEGGAPFHPELGALENIYLYGAMLGLNKISINKCISEVCDFADISEYLNTPMKKYSSGMYARLAFSAATHLEPNILIADEILSASDAAFREKAANKLKDLARKGCTIILVGHNDHIQSICDRQLTLDKGEIIRQ